MAYTPPPGEYVFLFNMNGVGQGGPYNFDVWGQPLPPYAIEYRSGENPFSPDPNDLGIVHPNPSAWYTTYGTSFIANQTYPFVFSDEDLNNQPVLAWTAPNGKLMQTFYNYWIPGAVTEADKFYLTELVDGKYYLINTPTDNATHKPPYYLENLSKVVQYEDPYGSRIFPHAVVATIISSYPYAFPDQWQFTKPEAPKMPLPDYNQLTPPARLYGRYLIHTDAQVITFLNDQLRNEIPLANTPNTNKTLLIECDGFIRISKTATFCEYQQVSDSVSGFMVEKIY